ncbi:MAG TPA: Stk1 family PASTA domain-containing Ser/Thr kinase [Candidatus Nanopelagicales bacterium]
MSDVRRLGDRYEVGELLGRGGMAEVHEGRDLRLGRRVAIKILKPELARDPAFLARFRREAQSAASLNHPNVVAVYDTGEDVLGEGPNATVVPFIVMELVEGRTLKELLHSGTRIAPERALEITAGILAALDYSHRHGIVHRDIKPGNVMLTPTGSVKVMDFGIARATADAGQTGTSTSTVLGTAAYLSPEQAQGRSVDARSDLYSTGVVLFELLTRRPPFVGDSPVAVAFAHVNEAPPAPSAVDPSVPADLDPLVLRALAKDPAARYQSAAEFRADVERAIAGVPVTQVLPAAAGGAGDATAVLGAPDAESTAALGAAGLAGAAGIGALAGAAAARTGPMPPVIPGGAGEAYPGGWGPEEPPPPAPPARGGGFLRGLGIVAVLGLVLVGVGWLAMNLLSSSATPTVEVPSLTGKTVSQADAALREAGLRLGREDAEVSERPEGTVIQQSPQEGARVDEGSEVNIVVSAGPDQATVPDLVNFSSLDDVRKALEDVGLVLGQVREQDSDQPKESVLRQQPEAYETVDKGSAVDVWISNGMVEVPNVVGRSQEQARGDLLNRGFEVVIGDPIETTDLSPGTVVRQSPEGGQTAEKGSQVTLQLAVEPPPPPTPTPSASDLTGGGADGQGGDGLGNDPAPLDNDTSPGPLASAAP